MYVHVPFCARRCSYCDFSIAVRRTVPWQAYAASLARELQLREEQPRTVQSIYLGGGTPSRLGGDGVAAVLDAVRVVCTPSETAEITIEVNPEDVTPASARRWVQAGVNRASVGVQSFDDAVLHWMHRVHAADAVPRAIDTLRAAGLVDLSVDLIFAVPAALQRDWPRDLDLALALDPTHVSLYGLTIEGGTPLGRWTARGEVHEAPEESYESEFLLAHDTFTGAGFEHYEVSNYGQPGFHARHNGSYWRGVPYLGLGPSAHGFDGRERRWNVAAYAEWARRVSDGHDPCAGRERLTADNVRDESVYLGLRTSQGLAMAPGDDALVAPWLAAGWVTVAADGRLRCTARGWLRLDGLAAALTASRSR